MKNTRRKTPTVKIGKVWIGYNHPIAIQSMTDTPTADIPATLKQTIELIDAGSVMVRWTINDDKAAQSAPAIIDMLRDKGYTAPIIGDFHFNGHLLLQKHTPCAKLLSKYRINPGNIGKNKQRDENFSQIIKIAIEHNKAVRIGVNSGSLDRELLALLMNKNSHCKEPKSDQDIVIEGMIQSALTSARFAEKLGLKKEKIVLSVKMSMLPDMVAAYTRLAAKCDYALHLGLTEAGGGIEGITASTAALAILLQQGIGDTIRVSLTPGPGANRRQEVEVCRNILQSLGLRHFQPSVVSCPGCGRTGSHYFQHLAENVRKHIAENISLWKEKYPGSERLTVAVMRCVVNGPGESRRADIALSLPGSGEKPTAPVFADGKQIILLKGENIGEQFIRIIDTYVAKRFSKGTG